MPLPARIRVRSRVLALLAAVPIGLVAFTGCGVPPPDNPPATTAAVPAVGVNADAADHSVALRNLFLPDPGTAGYPAGGSAPVAVQVWNNTTALVSLTAATAGGAPVTLVLAGQTPTAGATFDLPIPPGTSVGLTQQTGRFLLIRCVPVTLAAGTAVPMTFTFSNGAVLTVDAPVGLVVSVAAPLPTRTPAC